MGLILHGGDIMWKHKSKGEKVPISSVAVTWVDCGHHVFLTKMSDFDLAVKQAKENEKKRVYKL